MRWRGEKEKEKKKERFAEGDQGKSDSEGPFLSLSQSGGFFLSSRKVFLLVFSLLLPPDDGNLYVVVRVVGIVSSVWHHSLGWKTFFLLRVGKRRDRPLPNSLSCVVVTLYTSFLHLLLLFLARLSYYNRTSSSSPSSCQSVVVLPLPSSTRRLWLPPPLFQLNVLKFKLLLSCTVGIVPT